MTIQYDSDTSACPSCGTPYIYPLMWHGIYPPNPRRACNCFPDPWSSTSSKVWIWNDTKETVEEKEEKSEINFHVNVTLFSEDIEEIIKNYLLKQGFEPVERIRYSIIQDLNGYRFEGATFKCQPKNMHAVAE